MLELCEVKHGYFQSCTCQRYRIKFQTVRVKSYYITCMRASLWCQEEKSTARWRTAELSTTGSAKPSYIFNRMSVHFPAASVGTEPNIFNKKIRTVSEMAFVRKHNRTTSTPLSQHTLTLTYGTSRNIATLRNVKLQHVWLKETHIANIYCGDVDAFSWTVSLYARCLDGFRVRHILTYIYFCHVHGWKSLTSYLSDLWLLPVHLTSPFAGIILKMATRGWYNKLLSKLFFLVNMACFSLPSGLSCISGSFGILLVV